MARNKSQTRHSKGNVSSKELPSPPFAMSFESLKHASTQSIVIKRYLQLAKLTQNEHTEPTRTSDDDDQTAPVSQERVNFNQLLLNEVKHSNEIYEKCLKMAKKDNLNSLLQLLIKHPLFCPYQFMHYFFYYPFRERSNAKRSMRKLVMIETIQAIVKCKYNYVENDIWAQNYWESKNQGYSPMGDDVDEGEGNEENIDDDEEEELYDEEDIKSDDQEEDDIEPEDDGADQIPSIVAVQLNWNKLVSNVKAATMIKAPEQPSNDKRKKKVVTEDRKPVSTPRFNQCDVVVIGGDCLRAAMVLKKHRLNPLMLIMASPSQPGGGYKKGSGAQEEEICRRSTLFLCLEDPYLLHPDREWSYPLPEFGGVYIPHVTVIRDSERGGYAFLPKPVDISMIAVAAYNSPPIERVTAVNDEDDDDSETVEYRLSGKIIPKIKQKIRFIFDTAIEKKHDSVVLSAFGCGAYCSPAKSMAELFKQVLAEPEYKLAFKYVLFAIIDDVNAMANHANTRGNLLPFFETFHPEQDISNVLTTDQFDDKYFGGDQ